VTKFFDASLLEKDNDLLSLLQKSDPTIDTNLDHISDVFFTIDADGSFVNKLIHLQQKDKKVRFNVVFNPAQHCDPSTSPKYQNDKDRVVQATNTTWHNKTSVLDVYLDKDEFVTKNNSTCTLLKFPVVSGINPYSTKKNKWYRNITLGSDPVSNDLTRQIPNITTLNSHQLHFNPVTRVFEIDESAAIFSKVSVHNIITNSPGLCLAPTDYLERAFVSQLKRLGDHVQIDYMLNFPLRLSTLLKGSGMLPNSNIISSYNNNPIYNRLTNTPVTLAAATSLGGATLTSSAIPPSIPSSLPADYLKSDLISSLSGKRDIDRLKILRKRCFHVTIDTPAYCWAIFNKVNCILKCKEGYLVGIFPS
jgi:hypothetical protein